MKKKLFTSVLSALLNTSFIMLISGISVGALTISAQEKLEAPKITEAEKKEAEEIAVRFAVRFSQTKDLTPLVSEFFADDFFEIYKKEILDKIGKNEKHYQVSGISFEPRLLREMSAEDWEKLYISANNFQLSSATFFAREALNRKEDELDKIIGEMFSPRLRELFNNNPNLADFIEDEEKSKPVGSVQELKIAIETINQGTALFNEEHQGAITESEARKLFATVNQTDDENPRLSASAADEGEHGLAKGERMIQVVSPNMYVLILAKKDNKLKIVWAVLFAD